MSFRQLPADFTDSIGPGVLLSGLGVPLACLVATLLGLWSDRFRSLAAGALIAMGLVTGWSALWRFVSPTFPPAWVALVGALLAIGAGLGLVLWAPARDTPPA